MRLTKPSPSSLFLYAVGIATLAFIARSFNPLFVLALINAPLGTYYGLRKYRIFLIFLFIGAFGIFFNALIFSNTGQVVYSCPWFTIKEGAINSFLIVFLRIYSIFGSTLIFISLTNPREAARSLEYELRLPKGLAFSTILGLRMLSLLSKDAREIQLMRVQRGFRRYPILPNDLRTFLLPLLGLGYERGIWIGIATELRGLSVRPKRVEGLKLEMPEMFMYFLLVIQSALVVYFIFS